jgi:hypothetical protein
MGSLVRSATCQFCGTRYRARSNKKFCSDICRARSWREPPEVEVPPCCYCGMPSDSIDHIPPRAARPRIIEAGLASRYVFIEVDACRECNSLLGARTLWTLRSRKTFIRKALSRRYAKFLRIPDWDSSELASFSQRSMLRGYIERGLIVRDIVRQRLKWNERE